MARKMLFFLFTTALLIGLILPAFALEKMKLGTPIRIQPPLYLPILAAEEIGFWKENGLEVEWVPFGGGTPLLQAVAAGAINIGAGASDVPLVGAARGLPTVLVAVLTPSVRFHIFVKADSPYRHVRELKGAKIAITTLGSAAHVYGQVGVKAFGLEKDVRFVGTGSPPAMVASLKAGAVQAMANSLGSAFPVKWAGEIREIISVDGYLPEPWLEHVVFVRKDFARSKPDIVRKAIKAHFQAISFLKANPPWAIDKIKSVLGLSEEGAKALYESLIFTPTGRIDRRAVENARRLFVEYGVITEKTPAVDELFTNDYIP